MITSTHSVGLQYWSTALTFDYGQYYRDYLNFKVIQWDGTFQDIGQGSWEAFVSTLEGAGAVADWIESTAHSSAEQVVGVVSIWAGVDPPDWVDGRVAQTRGGPDAALSVWVTKEQEGLSE